MTCEHLRALERALLKAGVKETFRGQPWSDNCREWVYFECFIEIASVRAHIPLDACVKDHVHHGTHDGSERGLYCERCHDGVMGLFEAGPGTTVFRG